MEFQQVSDS